MKKTILIVEDNPDLRSSLRKVLIANNFKVLEAEDGAQALEIVEDSPPDLVLLDFVIPKVSGETVCVKIKKDYPHIVVIALTEKTHSRDVVHGLQIGADDYISKPFVAEELIARIDTRLKGAEAKDIASETLKEETVSSGINKISLRESIMLIAIRFALTELFFAILFMFTAILISFLGPYLGVINLFS